MGILYDGSTQYAQTGAFTGLGTAQTLMCWANITYNSSGSDIKGIVSGRWDVSGAIAIDMCYHYTSRLVRLQWFGNGTTQTETLDSATGIFEWDTWTHFCIKRDITNFYIYINGVEVKTSNDAAFTGNTDDVTNGFYFAHYYATTRRMKGSQFDCRFYERALSAEEIKTIYTCKGNDMITKDLIGRWLCDDNTEGATASNVLDISGNKKDATAIGSPTHLAVPCVYF